MFPIHPLEVLEGRNKVPLEPSPGGNDVFLSARGVTARGGSVAAAQLRLSPQGWQQETSSGVLL